MTSYQPVATIAVPVLNEEGSIVECLRRLREQSESNIEILVADGGSTDTTRELVAEIAREDGRIRFLENPRRLQAAGLNRCLDAARTPVLIRMDGHAFVECDYVERCLELIAETNAAVVGGVMKAAPKRGLLPAAIALANQSWWGAGPARFHGGKVAGPSETVYLGAIQTSVARALGGWAEDVGVNEDYEFNHRVRAAGHVVWFDPSLHVGYQPRSSLVAVSRQYLRYGRSKSTVMRRHLTSVRPRQVAPLVVAPCAIGSIVGPPASRNAARLGLCTYLTILAGGVSRARAPLPVRFLALVVALDMHLSWSAGVWIGTFWPMAAAGR